MNAVQFIISLALIFFVSRVALSAEPEVSEALKQMKTNIENSETNQKNYEKNKVVADDNVKAIEANIKLLQDQRTQVRENAKKSDQNIATMTKQEAQINDLIKKESATSEVEKKQIQELESKIAALKANIQKRETNTAQYKAKQEVIIKSKQDWMEQKHTAETIEKSINEKEKKAVADREEWKKKSAGHLAEALKWKKEADANRRQLNNYQNLNK